MIRASFGIIPTKNTPQRREARSGCALRAVAPVAAVAPARLALKFQRQ